MKKNILTNILLIMILSDILFLKILKIQIYSSSVEKKIISFCPGSRKKEIHIFMPIFLEIIKKYNNQFKYHFAVTEGYI